jgi:hypothetical protein
LRHGPGHRRRRCPASVPRPHGGHRAAAARVRAWQRGRPGRGEKGSARGRLRRCRGVERRAGWLLTRGCGAAAGEKGGKREAGGWSSCRDAGASGVAGRSEPGEGAGGGRRESRRVGPACQLPWVERRRGVETCRDGGLGCSRTGEKGKRREWLGLGRWRWAGSCAEKRKEEGCCWAWGCVGRWACGPLEVLEVSI